MASKLKKTQKNSPVEKSATDSATSSEPQTVENSEIENLEVEEDLEEDDVDVETEAGGVEEDAADAPVTGEDDTAAPKVPVTPESPADGHAGTEKRYAGGIPDGHIIRLGEEVTIPADEYKTYAVVKKDVYEETLPMGSKRISFRRLYRAGQTLPITALKRK